ncbi:MAG: steroid 5-alpha reductase [Halobacteriovoraceae bacterium]|nr:steroid 5-alpha reductase [Halobacteriovoraceae bacterium]|tara:strand:+ start:224 stop:988 length:765 start_codon:yes stop_codon:yes gene_type:complete
MAYLAPLILMHVFYLWALIRNDLSVVDIFWSLGFWVMSITSYLLLERPSFFQTVLLAMVTIWALRLAGYLGWRLLSHGVEDQRYTNMRKDWKGSLALNAYLRVYLLQFGLQSLIGVPLYFYFQSDQEYVLSANHFLGLAFFIYGFIFQSWGDFGLAKFKSKPENQGEIYTEGAWKYSQHPNYFGEASMWVGFFIFTMNVSPWWTAIGPMTIIFFLLKVSGIPLLKRSEKYAENSKYQTYKKRTSLFVPWFPEEN